MSWQNFEKEAQKFIKNKIEIPDIKIEFTGGSNSNDKDIRKSSKFCIILLNPLSFPC